MVISMACVFHHHIGATTSHGNALKLLTRRDASLDSIAVAFCHAAYHQHPRTQPHLSHCPHHACEGFCLKLERIVSMSSEVDSRLQGRVNQRICLLEPRQDQERSGGAEWKCGFQVCSFPELPIKRASLTARKGTFREENWEGAVFR